MKEESVTGRKPAGMEWESWVDRQIREAQERGEFDDLPGAGKPLPDRGRPYEEMWWVKRKLRDENLCYLPPRVIPLDEELTVHER